MQNEILRSTPVFAALVALGTSAAASDFVVPSGTVQVYDTTQGTLRADHLIVEAGGVLRVQGPFSFRVEASHVQVDGEIDLDGFDHPGVVTLDMPMSPVPGAPGACGGGPGGTASALTTQATPRGGNGFGAFSAPNLGGRGGESAFSVDVSGTARRAAGGGGGSFGPPALVAPGLEDPLNIGRIALSGRPGSASGLGAISQLGRPRGGGPGASPFSDSDPTNDFFGTKPIPGAPPIVGELPVPMPGQGGGAGGDSVRSAIFPPATFAFGQHDQGCGGGGGGGLGLILARTIAFGPAGRIHADGGTGGGGESTLFLNRIGGGSGGGSGGMLLLQARAIDLSQAQPDALRALGGRGGPGADDLQRAEGAGGHGGPGLIQLHVPGGQAFRISLPPGATLSDVSAPHAHRLTIQPGL